MELPDADVRHLSNINTLYNLQLRSRAVQAEMDSFMQSLLVQVAESHKLACRHEKPAKDADDEVSQLDDAMAELIAEIDEKMDHIRRLEKRLAELTQRDVGK